LKIAHNSNTINEFEKFKNIFASDKNAANCEISNLLRTTNNNFEDLIEIDDNRVEMK